LLRLGQTLEVGRRAEKVWRQQGQHFHVRSPFLDATVMEDMLTVCIWRPETGSQLEGVHADRALRFFLVEAKSSAPHRYELVSADTSRFNSLEISVQESKDKSLLHISSCGSILLLMSLTRSVRISLPFRSSFPLVTTGGVRSECVSSSCAWSDLDRLLYR
jgi:hypothetical protein